ncbi:MAG: aldo/keto reductase, partial [Muribaculum sp.]|nr:aldo/keto reductase [Muribaculum sp.]
TKVVHPIQNSSRRDNSLLNQLQCNPLMQENGIQEYLKEFGTRMMAWGPLGGHEVDGVRTSPVLAAIGEQYGKSISQVALRWLTQRGIVAIPKSTHKERMAQNLDIFDFTLSDEDMKKIAGMNRHDSGIYDFSDPKFVRNINNLKV